MVENFWLNCRNPQGWMGKIAIGIMNVRHAAISKWGLSHLQLEEDVHVLDIGCGGGANVKRLLEMYPTGFVEGLDFSEQSVAVSRKKNVSMLGRRCDIRLGSVSTLPYSDGVFDAATAFETVYFWPNAAKDFIEIHRILRPGGVFLICNAACDPTDETWTRKIAGMRIYGKDELIRLLSDSGFEIVGSDTHEHGWFCVVAKTAR
jgi:ubiquinone/menaquinone biosynthesis C-methylase UbiE